MAKESSWPGLPGVGGGISSTTFLAGLAGKVGKGDIVLSVKDYGATGNGTTDDTAAIQAAVNAAATFGATVFFPPGTYIVAPDATYKLCVRIPAGLRGMYGDSATIKVKSGVGNYHAVISNWSSQGSFGSPTTLTHLVIRDLTIDQNSTGNVVTDPSPYPGPMFNGFPRFAVAIQGGMNAGLLKVLRVRVLDIDGVNTFYALARDIVIDDCDLTVSTVATDHDTSAIYTNCNIVGGSVRITGNRINAPSVGNVGARTAIETHGGTQDVSANTVKNFFKAGNVTGVEVFPGQGIRWFGNKFLNVRYGLQLWSRSYATNTGPYGLRNAQILNNLITLDPAGWTPGAVSTDVRGLFLDNPDLTVGTGLPFVDITIDGNEIVFLTGHTGHINDSNCHGIDWKRLYPPASGGVDRNIRITRNTITGAIGSGIRVATVSGDYADAFTISDNIIRNPGQGTSPAGGALSTGFANGIMLVGQLKNSRVNNNLILDDQTTPTTNDGLYLVPQFSGSSNNEAIGNRVPVANNKKIETSTSLSGGWLIRMDHGTYSAVPGIVAVGSEIRDLATGTVYRQVTAPEGVTWQIPGVTARRPGLASQWTAITNRPLMVPGTATGTLAKDSWRFLPIRLTEDLTIDALSVATVTTPASGGTAALIFGLFAADSTNRPGARVADYSSYGSIDLTQAAGILQLATVGLTIPAGEWWLGLAWSGTATVSPIMQTVTGLHPAIASVSAVTTATAYLQAVSGATVPSSATPSTTATSAPMVHGKIR
jgi:hypothetical protein